MSKAILLQPSSGRGVAAIAMQVFPQPGSKHSPGWLMQMLMALLILCAFSQSVLAVDTGITTNTNFPAGSYIVDTGSAAQTVANGLKPYGLVYDLIVNKKTPVHWVISPTKTKNCASALCVDGDDFSVAANVTGATAPAKNYRGGTFVISGEFVDASVVATIASWKGLGVLVDGPTVAAMPNLPVYGRLTSYPRVVLDTAKGSLVVPYFAAAGIPSTAYTLGLPAALTGCDDVYVMPHADPALATHGALVNFLTASRGYVWAACHSVSVLENLPGMNFLSTGGLVPFTAHVAGVPPNSYAASEGANPIMQFINRTDSAHQNGSEQVYLPKIGSAWRAATTIVAESDPDHPNIPALSAGQAAVMVSGRAFGVSTNGRVMYEGGHSHAGTTADQVSAQRALLNFTLLAGIDRRIELDAKIPPQVSATASVPVSVKILVGGNAPFTYAWTSSCGGSFASATSASTTFTAPSVTAATTCQLKVIVADACGRTNFESGPIKIKVAKQQIGIAKRLGTPVLVSLGVYDVPYTLTLKSLGSLPLTNVQVDDNLAAAFPSPASIAIQIPPVASAPLTINAGYTGKGINKLLAGTDSLPVGSTEYTITYTVRVTLNGSSGTFTSQASATSAATAGGLPVSSDLSNNGAGTEIDPNDNGDPSEAGENTGTPVTLGGPIADLEVTQTGPATVAPNGTITYQIVVKNLGPGAASGALFSDLLPTGFTITSATCAAPGGGTTCGTVVIAGNQVSSTITTLNSGKQVSFTIVGTAPASGTLLHVPRAIVPAGTGDPTDPGNTGAGNNSTSLTTVVLSNGTVSGHVFNDVNGNLVQDAGEADLAGLVVTITTSASTAITTSTDSAGNYSLSVPAGNTSLNVADPAGYVLTTANDPQTIMASSGTNVASSPVGFRSAATITGVVFNDANGDAIRGATELGLVGVTLQLLSPGPDGTPGTSDDVLVATTVTDADGAYRFAGVVPGTYLVREIDPAGFDSTSPNAVAVNIPLGGAAVVDFADQQQTTVAGSVYNDSNGNALRDAGDVGIAGVTIQLFSAGPDALLGSADDLLVATKITAAAGSYSFTNVAPGSYLVRELADPSGFVSTTPNSLAVTVSAFGSASAQFGEQLQGSIAGTVFNDANGDGLRDPTEAGVAAVTVKLIAAGPDGVLGTADDVVAGTITTNANGVYSFVSQPAGAYTVTETLPAGYVSTTPKVVAVTLPVGGVANAQFGVQQQNSISGTVFNDSNGNGFQDPGETGLAGVLVELFNGSGILVSSRTTSVTGAYNFASVPIGIYTLVETDPSGFASTTPNTVPINLVAGTAVGVSFGDQQQATVNGTVFSDLNANGFQDAGEAGLVGVTIQLLDAGSNVVATTTTDASGGYSFTSVAAGSYMVREIDPASFTSTTSNDVAITVPVGGAGSAQFGDQPVGKLTGTVFNDLNGDGVQAGSENGMGGVIIELIGTGNIVINTATSLADGGFAFFGLAAGSYQVRKVVDPAGFTGTSINPVSVTVPAGGAGVANFAEQQSGSVSGTVFNDPDASGTQNPAEAGLGGVTIQLVNPTTSAVISTAVTTADGSYQFSGIAPGIYTVREVPPSSYQTTSPVTVSVTLAPGGAASANFGVRQVGTVTGHVYLDLNGDGVQSTGEPNLSSVAVTITPSAGAAINVATNANGDYTALVPAGSVSVNVTDPVGTVLTTSNDPQVVVVAAGNTVVATAIGFQPVGSVGGHVFEDLNGNGVQDIAEPNLAGIAVTVVPSVGPPLAFTTDVNGNFTALVPAGSSVVTVNGPVGEVLTTANAVQTVSVATGGAASTANVGFHLAQADISVAITGFPLSAAAGASVSGTVTCTNLGVDAAVAPACAISPLPFTATIACLPNPLPATLPVGAEIVCGVSFVMPASGAVVLAATTSSATSDAVPGNNSASVTIASGAYADMTATTTVPASVSPGQAVTVSGVCTNNGPAAATTPTCALSGMPSGTTQSCTATPASLAISGSLTCNATFTAPASGTLDITTTAASTTPDPIATNNAQTKTITVTAVDQADMRATISGFPTTALAGSTVTGTATCTNAGPSAAAQATCAITGAPAGAVITCLAAPPVVSLAVNAVITCSVSYVMPATGGVTITATAGSTTADGLAGNEVATATTTAAATADVTTTLSGFPTTANAGVIVSGTVNYSNAATATASALGVSYQITLPTSLTGVTCGAPASCVYNTATGIIAITGLPTTLAAGATATHTLSFVQPASGVSFATSLITTTSNQGANAAADNASVNIGGAPVADVNTTVTLPSSPVAAASTVNGNVTFGNNGASPAAAVTYAMTLSNGLTGAVFGNLPSGAAAAYNATTGAVVFTGMPSTLTVGQTLPVISFTITAPASGTITASSAITTTTAENGLIANNNATASVSVTALPEVDLQVSLAGFPATSNPGVNVSGVMTCSNAGPGVAVNSSCTASGLPTGATVTCTPTSPVAALVMGAAISCSVSYTAPVSGSVTVTGTAASSTAETITANNVASATIPVTTLGASIAVANTIYATQNSGLGCATAMSTLAVVDRLAAGVPVTYCFKATNTGAGYLHNLALADDALDNGINAQVLAVGATALVPGSGTLPLAPGASISYYRTATIVHTLTSAAVMKGTPTTAAGIATGQADVTGSGQSILTAIVNPPASIKSGKPVSQDIIEWITVLVNTSAARAQNVSVSDPVPTNTTYVGSLSCQAMGSSTTTSCGFESPSAAFPQGRVYWTGQIGPDALATTAANAANRLVITFRVKVAAGVTAVTGQASSNWSYNADGVIGFAKVLSSDPTLAVGPTTVNVAEPIIAAVPTLSEWALIMLAALLGAGAMRELQPARRRGSE